MIYNPLVSIITPTLNNIQCVKLCIENVLHQSYPHIEHIFVDGDSIDGTLDILLDYSTAYPNKVRYMSESDNSSTEAVSKGFSMAKGQILGQIGSDDTYEPDTIQIVVDFFKANPNAYFVFGDCNLVNKRGEIVKRVRPKDFDLKKSLDGNFDVPGTSTFYKREVIEQVGYSNNPEAKLASDIDLLVRAAKVFEIHRIDKVLSNWGFHKWDFTGNEWAIRKTTARSFYLISRRYGGRFFSGHRKRYYMLLIIDWLKPIIGYFYPYLAKLLNRKYESHGRHY